MAMNTLALYNIALGALGERTLDSTAENRPTRRELDKVATSGNGYIPTLLHQGLWNFATLRSALTASTSVPGFGFTTQYPLPSDFVRLVNISTSSTMTDPLLRYEIEAASSGVHILSDSTAVFIRYVSDSTIGGADLSKWPETFTLWAGHWLATQVFPTVKEPKVSKADLQALTDRLLTIARQRNAAESAVPFPERGLTTMEHRELDYQVEIVTLPGISQQQR